MSHPLKDVKTLTMTQHEAHSLMWTRASSLKSLFAYLEKVKTGTLWLYNPEIQLEIPCVIGVAIFLLTFKIYDMLLSMQAFS